ncbi:TonB-dependent receptor [Sphingobium nicotianae]|uniref:TonB-dependent receptor n=1 Tax=Sphingobium nicotianae TaxID=2782607 RepID=A0A9X1DDN1_9SPHN|nr:TonB-dependent receptor [Sphingobium nicotianae]MBT2187986.1 TonB-dependent receptor [Sphingobium nicotianae]
MRIAILLATTALSLAAPALAQAPADDAEGGADIVVFGRGETRQVQEVSAADLVTLTPGTSPLKAIEKLPSVNFQSADPFGNYEWSTRVTIRAFSQNQLGFTFDGIPLGDMSYGNMNGLHISRAISPENIGVVRVSQGAGSIGTQSTNNLGGTVETFSMDPADSFKAQGNLTYGSNETWRGFARVNMGVADGIRGFVSYAYGATNKYRGSGTQDQHMANAKIVVPAGAATLDGWLSYSDRREQDYQDMSLGMIQRLGWGWDNTAPDWNRAVLYADIGNNRGETGAPVSNAAAGKVYPGNVTTVDDAYYDAAGLRKDTLASIGLKSPLGDMFKVALRGYYHHNKGMGLWATPYVPSPNGVPISVRTTEYKIDRGGIFGTVGATIGINEISVGAWYENNKFNQARRFYALASRTAPGFSFRTYPTNPFATQWAFDFSTDTFQYHVQDKIDLGMIKVNLGWKGYKVTSEATAIVGGGFPQGKIGVTDWFQPHTGIVAEITPEAELFAGFTQVTRAYQAATTAGPFSTTQAGFDAIKNTLKPESSDTYELGARYNQGGFHGVVGVYLVNFHNRLLVIPGGAGIVGAPNVLANVGGVQSLGFEAAGDLKLGAGFSLYASYSYTDSTYQDDVKLGTGTVVPISGKTVVDSPRHMARGELAYDQGPIYGRVGVNYMSKRYFSYMNDASVPSRVLVDASVGYRFTPQIELQLNATNIFDKEYVGTIGSNGFSVSGDSQTLLIGAPQQFFATLKAGF